MTPFETYRAYILVKAHYTGNYDYFKYGGKSPSVSSKSFESRSDKFRFEKLAHKIIDPVSFFACNMAYDARGWIGDLRPEDNEPYRLFESFVAAPVMVIENDLNQIQSSSLMKALLQEDSAKSAEISTLLRTGKISLETVALLESKLNFCSTWLISKNPVDVTLVKKIQKYSPFVSAKVPAKFLIKAINNTKKFG